MTRATSQDIPLLIELMADFYAEAGYQLDRDHAAAAFAELLADEQLGFVWLLGSRDECAGHMVVTLRYGMEYGGLIACLDDLYVRPARRNRGLATSSIRDLRQFCQARGIRALTVEVGVNNGPALKAYGNAGFAEAAGRQILALPLAAPSHVESPAQ